MKNRIEIFKSADNKVELKVALDNETVWLSQEQFAIQFEKNQSVISRHISNMQKMHIANSDKPVAFYNLDVIISVGYRVQSIRGAQIRQGAASN